MSEGVLDALAEQAAALRDERYDSPKVKLWKKRAREYVESEYGEDARKILDQTLFFNRAITRHEQGQRMHRERMDDAIIFLEELKAEPAVVATPPSETSVFLSLDDLHPALLAQCKRLYEAGHLAEAVERSFKVVRGRLRELTGYETGSEAFGKRGLRVRGAVEPWVEEDFNEAVKFLTMAIDRFRNEKAHTADAQIDEPVRAAEYLAMSSLSLRLLDRAYVVPDA